jgi:hypothetical protein
MPRWPAKEFATWRLSRHPAAISADLPKSLSPGPASIVGAAAVIV